MRAQPRQSKLNPVRNLAAAAIQRALAVDDPRLVRKILAASQILHLEAGDVLFKEGDPADAAFIVAVGRIALIAGTGQTFEEVERGGIVGSSAFLEEGVRQAGASAARDSVLVRLPREALEELAVDHPRAVLALTRHLFASMAPPLGRRASSRHNAIVVVGATPAVDTSGFATALADALRRQGSAAVVGPKDAAEGASRDADPDPVAVTRWLYELEEANASVVYVAGDNPAWTRLAVRQSDRVLLVANAAEEPDAAHIGSVVDGHAARKALLILVNRGSIPPGGAARWLDAVGARAHLHVTEGSVEDTARVARIVSGRATTIVFGGGGARAFAHAGVVRAIRECGVPIDAVAGTSAGAIVAAYVAAGREAEIVGLLMEGFSNLRDVTLPVSSLLKGRRTTSVLRRQFGEIRIEDLPLSFFCTSTDITDHVVAYHDRGDLVRALRASSAIAGVYPPVPIEGHLHIDGGVMNNVPADEMRRRYPDASIVAIDVSPVSADGVEGDYGLWLSGWTALRRKLRGRRTVAPGLADTLVRATVAASTSERMRLRRDSVADLFLALDVEGMGGLSCVGAEAAAANGYEQALTRLEEWMSS